MIDLIKIAIEDNEILKFAQNKEYDVNTEIKGTDSLTPQEMVNVTQAIQVIVPLLLKGMLRELPNE
mgnify:CR=1 FL=1